jgi:integrase
MGVKVRQHKLGWLQVDITGRHPNGTVFRERRKSPVSSKSGSQRWGEARLRHLLDNPTEEVSPGKPPSPTLAEFAPKYLEAIAANRQKASSQSSRETALRVHLIPFLGTRTLDSISAADVAALKVKLSEKAPSTVNHVLTALSGVLKLAKEFGLIAEAPRVKLLPLPESEAAFYTFEDYARLLTVAEADGIQSLVMVLLGGHAGLRLGEMLALEWERVDFERKRLTVSRSDWEGNVSSTKGKRSRHIPMTSRLEEALRRIRHLRGPLVLCDEKGKALTKRVLQRTAERLARKAKLETAGVHILRHTFCSHLAMLGAPARAIQELAGHRDLVTTQKYMHLSPAAVESAIRLLGSPERHELGNMLETASSPRG